MPADPSPAPPAPADGVKLAAVDLWKSFA
ncbi:MAG: hypothetical protein H6Q02_310, partial [Acidobacteria bacterium]|nr:hypothetical protein [Acidobacteriota bacterium]